ncbi:MAG TPA: transglutaminase-like domain-containing protein [Gemmatimonadales bacterium]|jgi:transglutaminase-like putative cysteine protease|nr:transglutaminase-like domain-containing protein [Gemmatimonadales bacterium]
MTRRQWAIGILAAWVLSLGWLVKREFFRSTGARLAEAALSVPPGALFYRLDLGGQQIGFASSTLDTLPDSIRVEDLLVLDVPALGKLHRTSARSVAVLSRALRLARVEAVFDGDLGRFTARGNVLGDSVLRVTIVTETDSQTTRIPLTGPITLPTLLPLRLAFGGELRPGRTYTARLFNPLLLAEQEVTVRVAAESTLIVPDSADIDSTTMTWVPVHFDTVRAFRIDQQANGIELSTWIDAQGRIVSATTPVGFRMDRAAFELAYENFRRRDTARVARGSTAPAVGDVIALTALAAGVREELTRVERLRVRLSGADLSRLDLTSGRQNLAGDTLEVTREGPTAMRAGYSLPARDPALTPWLEPEPLIQVHDPRIAAQARQIVGRERGPTRAAELLTHWVYANLRKQVTLSVPSAAQVLEAGRGDCNEHTALYVALARAVGLPARTAAGLVYLNDRFYYHAWPEVYLGDWVAVDPTFDQFPADAAHLRFTIGGLARQVELIRVVGRLQLEVL